MTPGSLHTCVALLRGINVGGNTSIPMAELRALCADLGWQDVRTYIQSGNVVFRGSGSNAVLEEQLEAALPGEFGVTAAVIVRHADEWQRYPQTNPFVKEAETDAGRVMLALTQKPLKADAVDRLRERATTERIERAGDALWIYYADGAGRSKVTPGLLDRCTGSPTTTRNLRTVLKLQELANG